MLKNIKYIFVCVFVCIILGVGCSMAFAEETSIETYSLSVTDISYEVSENNSDLLILNLTCDSDENITDVIVTITPRDDDTLIYINQFEKTNEDIYECHISKSEMMTKLNVMQLENAEITINVGSNLYELPINCFYSFNEAEYHNIIFENYDGTDILRHYMKEGDLPSVNSSLFTKPDEGRYCYIFSGWVPEISSVESDIVYTAQFTKSVRETQYSGKCGEADWLFYEDCGLLVITGSGIMDDFWGYGLDGESPWDNLRDNIKQIEIDSGITYIGYANFYGLPNLEKVVIAEGVTEINAEVFEDCTALEEIHLPKSVETVWEMAFYGCTRLDRVYYGGTSAEWNLIDFTEDNEALSSADLICEGDGVNITEILPLRTHRVEFNNDTKTITVKALSGNATAGIGIVTEETSTWSVNDEDKTRLGLVVANSSALDGAQVVVAKQEKGMEQSFEVDITCGTKTETYTVNLEFIDESLINFTDVLGVRIVSYDVNYASHKINLMADRYSTVSLSAGFGLVLPENVSAEYTLLETTDGGTTVSRPTTTAYTSTYLGMESGYYGAMPVRVMPMSNGVTQVTEAVLTNTVLGESITWTINLMFRDPAHEGDVDISELIGLRTTSATFDNEAKTITLVAPSNVSSAGCTAISDNPSTVRQFTAESGMNLAYGTLDGERYVVAYKSYGATQTYRVKVFGGEDGYEYSWYTVTITFEDAPLTMNMDSNATLGGEMFEINSTEEVELEEVVWVDDYEASLEEIPQNLVWNEELLDFVPAE